MGARAGVCRVMGGGGRSGHAAHNPPPKPEPETVVLNFFIPLLYCFFPARLEKTESLSYHTIWAYPEGQSSEIRRVSVS